MSIESAFNGTAKHWRSIRPRMRFEGQYDPKENLFSFTGNSWHEKNGNGYSKNENPEKQPVMETFDNIGKNGNGNRSKETIVFESPAEITT